MLPFWKLLCCDVFRAHLFRRFTSPSIQCPDSILMADPVAWRILAIASPFFPIKPPFLIGFWVEGNSPSIESRHRTWGSCQHPHNKIPPVCFYLFALFVVHYVHTLTHHFWVRLPHGFLRQGTASPESGSPAEFHHGPIEQWSPSIELTKTRCHDHKEPKLENQIFNHRQRTFPLRDISNPDIATHISIIFIRPGLDFREAAGGLGRPWAKWCSQPWGEKEGDHLGGCQWLMVTWIFLLLWPFSLPSLGLDVGILLMTFVSLL